MNRIFRSTLLIFAFAGYGFLDAAWAQSNSSPAKSQEILAMLRNRVQQNPQDANSWRLLGRALQQQEAYEESEQALVQAVTLTPQSAAAWFDLAGTLAKSGRTEIAVECYQKVIEIAPESEYATQAQTEIDVQNTAVVQAGYEVRTFDSRDVLNQLDDADPPMRQLMKDRLDFRLETGLLYNSNVALAPINRQIAPGDRGSAQIYVSPDLQYGMIDEGQWRTGPTLRGQFTLNEGNFSQFNLQSYRPGWFAEYFIFRDESVFVPRIAYEFTHDEFDRTTLGNRHTLLASMSAFWDDTHGSFVYYAIDNTDFLNDGILPSVTSQDGLTQSFGIAHDIFLPYRYLRLVRGGIDLSAADTDGSDYRYRGVNLFTEGVVPLIEKLELTVRGGWGYRDFYAYEFEPSRNENVWQAGAELRYYLTDNISTALIFNYDLFDSENPLFAAERYQSGLVIEMEF